MTVLGFLFGNWFARAYLLLVAVVAVSVFVILEVGGEDANLAGVWLILVTLSGSLLASPVAGLASGRLSTVIFFCVLAVSALINAAVISLVVHAVRRCGLSRAGSAAGLPSGQGPGAGILESKARHYGLVTVSRALDRGILVTSRFGPATSTTMIAITT